MRLGFGSRGREKRTVSPPGAPAGPGRCTQSVQPSHLCHMPGATMRGQQWAILPDLASRPCSGGKGRGRGGERSVFTGQTALVERQAEIFLPQLCNPAPGPKGFSGRGAGLPCPHVGTCLPAQ